MTATKENTERIEKVFDTAKQICLALAPLTGRAQRRLLRYLSDLVSDPDTGATLNEVAVLNQVRAMLDIPE